MYTALIKAFDAKKFSEALKQLDAIDARQPDLAASRNLRGVILMRQGNYDQAEPRFRKPPGRSKVFGMRAFNLRKSRSPKDWGRRGSASNSCSPWRSDLAKEASQLIQYKILLTYLMGRQREHGGFHFGQAGTFARYPGC